jgi:hypothetical protein
MGLLADGETPCCEEARPNFGFVCENKEDKGGPKGKACFLYITKFQHEMITDVLTLRNARFSRHPDLIVNKKMKDRLFLMASGKGYSRSKTRLYLLNKAVQANRFIFPQMIRSYHQTWMADDKVLQGMRSQLAGNSEDVFDRHYDARQIARFQDAFYEVYRAHGPNQDNEDANNLGKQVQDQRITERESAKEAEQQSLRLDPGVDLTSSKRPMPSHIRLEFR